MPSTSSNGPQSCPRILHQLGLCLFECFLWGREHLQGVVRHQLSDARQSLHH